MLRGADEKRTLVVYNDAESTKGSSCNKHYKSDSGYAQLTVHNDALLVLVSVVGHLCDQVDSTIDVLQDQEV